MKRTLDVGVSVFLMLCLLPALVLIALAIRIDSGGPIFFTQLRLGGRRRKCEGETMWTAERFRIYKFRTMHASADESVHKDLIERFVNGEPTITSSGRSTYKPDDDSRVTTVGRLLRRYSLDELPQLWNVFVGEMSLVGPRPVPDYEVDLYREGDLQRFASRSGLTGPWQVSGRAELSFGEMIDLDLDYVRCQSMIGDIGLIFKTLPAIIRHRGAA